MKNTKTIAPETMTNEIYQVTIYRPWGRKEVINNVISFGPIPNTNLLAVTPISGEKMVYVLNDIKKYSFHVVKA